MNNIPKTYCKIMDSKCPAFHYGQCRRFEPCQHECAISMEVLACLVSKILEQQSEIMKGLMDLEKQR